MGFLQNLKAQIEAAQAAGLAMSGAESASAVPDFIDPWPQQEVDRLLTGTGTVRAIVLGTQHQNLQSGERVGAMGVRVKLRQRLADGALGDTVVLKATLSSMTATLVQPGLDIPVERDAAGTLTKVASKQLTAELAHRSEEAKRRNPAWGLDDDIEGIIDVAKRITRAGSKKPPAAPGA